MITTKTHLARALWPTLYSKFWLTTAVAFFFEKSQLWSDSA